MTLVADLEQRRADVTQDGGLGEAPTWVSAIPLSGDLARLSTRALRPEEGHVVLADPEGNEFCVIEPGNAFHAGCGLLGELACDGTREVGLFWSEALGWPLVWDQDQETAIQSPRGGTKVAWGVSRRIYCSRERIYREAGRDEAVDRH